MLCSKLVCLQDAIQKNMAKDMVEPKRKYVDMEATYKKHLLNKAAGPGGLLIITVVQARDLRSTAATMLCTLPEHSESCNEPACSLAKG